MNAILDCLQLGCFLRFFVLKLSIRKKPWSRSLVCVRLHQKFLHDLGSWQECQRERHQEGLRMLGLIFKAWLEASSPVFCRPSCQAQHSKKASWSRSLVCVRLHPKFLHDLGSWQECQRERHQEGLRMLGFKLQGLARSFKPSVLQAFLSSSAFEKASWSRSCWQECQRERHQEGLRMLGLKLQGLARSFKPSVLQAFLSSSAFEKSLLKSILGLCPAAPKISTWSWELTRVPARATSWRPTNAWLEA